MRRFLLSALLLTATGFSVPSTAFVAPSDVYVPPETNQPNATPVPSAQTQAPTAPQQLTLRPLPPTTPPPRPAAMPALTEDPTIKSNANIRDILNHIMDTRVAQLTPPQPPAKNMTQSIIVSVGSNLGWGPSDGDNVSRRLGVPYARVPQVCNIVFNGNVASDSGSSSFSLNPENSNVSVGYNGTLRNVTVEAFASCPATQRLPAHAGTIYQSGNQYLVSLGPVECAAPPVPPPAKVDIVYGGNKKGSCQYE